MFYAVWENWEDLSVGESFLVAIIAILIVFLTLTIIIGATYLFEKGIKKIEKKTLILPKKENEILNNDEDAVVALLTATIDFHNETNKDAKVVSITKIEE